MSLRGVRTNTIPRWLSTLRLASLDLAGLDVRNRGGGAISLPPDDESTVGIADDGDGEDEAPPAICGLLRVVLEPPLSESIERLDASIALDDAEAIVQEVVGSMGEPDDAVLEALSWAFFCGAEAEEGDGGAVRCPKLSRLWLSSWHGIAMSQLIDDGGGASARWSEVVAAGEETGPGASVAAAAEAREYVCKT